MVVLSSGGSDMNSRRRIYLAGCIAALLAFSGLVAASPASAVVTPPSISSISPKVGKTAGGTRVTVLGHGFRRVAYVNFGTVRGTNLRVISPTKLLITAPKHAAGVTNIRVRASGITSAIRAVDRFTYIAPPAVTSITPNHGLNGGGYNVIVNGARFTRVLSVQFVTHSGEVFFVYDDYTVLSSTKIRVTVPALESGVSHVRIVTAYGSSPLVAASAFTSEHKWSPGPAAENVTPPDNAVVGLDCATTTFCMAVDLAGNAIKYSSGSWAAPVAVEAGVPLNGVACTSSSFCVAVGETGHAFTYNGTSWSSAASTGVTKLDAVACSSSSYCLAGGRSGPDGDLASGALASFNGSTWADVSATNREVKSISCPSGTFCAVGERNGTTTTWSGGSKTSTDGLQGDAYVACTSSTFCISYAGGSDFGQVPHLLRVFNGTSWADGTPPPGLGTFGLSGLECTSTTFCVAADPGNGWYTFSGAAWDNGESDFTPREVSFSSAMSCVSGTTFCMTMTASGSTYIRN